MTLFPGALPVAGTASSTDTLAAAGHTSLHNTDRDEIRAIATKIGTGSSTPVAGQVLRGTAANTSVWGAVSLTADVTGVLPVANGGTGQNSLSALPLSAPVISAPVITGGGSWAGSPTITTPTIASFTNAQHDHINAAGGGVLGANTVGSSQIINGSVSVNELGDGGVTADKLGLGVDTAYVATGETTTSTSYTDLATTTDTITVTVGANGKLLVGISCLLQNSGANFSGMSFALSGANTLAASDENSWTANITIRGGVVIMIEGLSVGATTVKAKYVVSTGTGTFTNRKIWAVPF